MQITSCEFITVLRETQDFVSLQMQSHHTIFIPNVETQYFVSPALQITSCKFITVLKETQNFVSLQITLIHNKSGLLN